MGLGDRIKDALKDRFDSSMDTFIAKFKGKAVEEMKIETALTSIKPEMFKDPELRKQVEKLKENWKHSPETASDIANDLTDIILGRAAKFQFETLTHIDITKGCPVTEQLFTQMGIITDLNLLFSVLGIIGSFIPLTQLSDIGSHLRTYLDYSGLSQVTGYGYGQILSSALGPIIAQEMGAKMQKNPADIQSLLVGERRGLITREEFLTEALKYGYSKDAVQLLYDLQEYYPPAVDFIRFAVREVFNDEVVKDSGLDEAYPAAIEKYAAKAGMPPEVLHWYWRSHWDLPSPTQGYDMFQRGIISEERLRSLFKQADYAPGWIDEMMELARQPLTRVDSRRMWSAGVLNDSEYVNALMALGYSAFNAQKLLEWSRLNNMDTEKDLTKAVIIEAWKLGISSDQQVIDQLRGLGYDMSEAMIILSIEQEKRTLEAEKEWLIGAHALVKAHSLSLQDFRTRLEARGYTQRQIDIEMAKATAAFNARAKAPTKADWDRWVKAEVVSVPQWRGALKTLGYADAHIDLWAKEWDL